MLADYAICRSQAGAAHRIAHHRPNVFTQRRERQTNTAADFADSASAHFTGIGLASTNNFSCSGNRLREQAAYLVLASVGTLLTAFGIGGRAGIAAGPYYLPHTTFAAAAFFLLADLIARRRGALRPAVPGAVARGLGPGRALLRHRGAAMAGLPPLSGFGGQVHAAAGGFGALGPALGDGSGAGRRPSPGGSPWRGRSLLFYRRRRRSRASAVPPGVWDLVPMLGLLLLVLGITLWAGPIAKAADSVADRLPASFALHPGRARRRRRLMTRLLPHPVLSVLWP